MRFTHLHVASSFSAHHGTTPPAQLVERAAQLAEVMQRPALTTADARTLLGVKDRR